MSSVDFPAFGFPRIAIGIPWLIVFRSFSGFLSTCSCLYFSSKKYCFLISKSFNSGKFLFVFALIHTISWNHNEWYSDNANSVSDSFRFLSNLFTIKIVWFFLLDCWIYSKICCSLAVIPTTSSITNKIISDSSIIFWINGRSSLNSKSHGLSAKTTSPISSNDVVWYKISAVVPGISVTIALNCQINLLNNVDFPTLVDPTNQICIIFLRT